MRNVIIDFHTHIFPPQVRENREAYVRRDPTFAEMYGDPRAKMATADDLLTSMDKAGVDVSVALGFAWRDHDDCVRHNDYLLEEAANSGGRIVPFCIVNPSSGEAATREIERCARGGALGLGELRPDSQGWPLNGEPGEALAELALKHDLILLFHVTEPGKRGLRLESFHRFLLGHPRVRVVGAHLAGGLPFDASMSEVRELSRAYVDTAARRFLYGDVAYTELIRLIAAERILLGSDFPLVSQASDIEDVRAGVSDEDVRALILGENGRRLLRLSAE
jgi:predicted TIM-barrel fold metal-dependent hydrolase